MNAAQIFTQTRLHPHRLHLHLSLPWESSQHNQGPFAFSSFPLLPFPVKTDTTLFKKLLNRTLTSILHLPIYLVVALALFLNSPFSVAVILYLALLFFHSFLSVFALPLVRFHSTMIFRDSKQINVFHCILAQYHNQALLAYIKYRFYTDFSWAYHRAPGPGLLLPSVTLRCLHGSIEQYCTRRKYLALELSASSLSNLVNQYYSHSTPLYISPLSITHPNPFERY